MCELETGDGSLVVPGNRYRKEFDRWMTILSLPDSRSVAGKFGECTLRNENQQHSGCRCSVGACIAPNFDVAPI